MIGRTLPGTLLYMFLMISVSMQPFFLPAQSLPEQMRFSEDQTRLTLGGNESQGFYDEDTIRNVYLEFHDPDFWQIMHDNFGTSQYVYATMTYLGEVFDSVAVGFKGQTSYNKAVKDGSEKLSFDVKLDEVLEGQDLEGYNTFNFNNAFQDFSFMKEVLYARLSRNHVPTLKGNFIRLFLNDEDWGLYVNMEQLNGDYIKEWFLSNDGIRWRADVPPPDSVNAIQVSDLLEDPPPGPNWGDGTAALNYLGPEAEAYQQYYTLKNSEMEDPWSYLVRVCDILNNQPLESLTDSLSPYMDLDGTLWFLAQEILFSDDDSYVHKGKMDYYLYLEPETGRMIPLEFDGNSAMNLRNATWSPFLNETDPNYPLLNRCCQFRNSGKDTSLMLKPSWTMPLIR